jgi:hypothetical protein
VVHSKRLGLLDNPGPVPLSQLTDGQFRPSTRGSVTFGDNVYARIVGKGIVSLDDGKTKTQNVLYVEGLKHNLLSVSQMCDQGYNLTFHSKGCDIMKVCLGILVENANRT